MVEYRGPRKILVSCDAEVLRRADRVWPILGFSSRSHMLRDFLEQLSRLDPVQVLSQGGKTISIAIPGWQDGPPELRHGYDEMADE